MVRIELMFKVLMPLLFSTFENILIMVQQGTKIFMPFFWLIAWIF
jgi:hypothetical protein